MSVPWTLAVSTALGFPLMFDPGIFGVDINQTAADIHHLGDALVIVVSVISMGEVVRRGRYLNILLRLVILIVPQGTKNREI